MMWNQIQLHLRAKFLCKYLMIVFVSCDKNKERYDDDKLMFWYKTIIMEKLSLLEKSQTLVGPKNVGFELKISVILQSMK